jgi:uncharacterized membrane protein YqgA involved in biofilm formation
MRSLSLAGKGIGLTIYRFRSVVNLEIKVGKEIEPLGLAIIFLAIGGEVGQVSVIRDDIHGMWEAFQKETSFFEASDDCEKFFVINLTINFSWRMLP